jgi:predicted enzyme related to lactoylglutathione lyase
MFRRVMYATLFVSDQDRAVEFYTSVLGFQKRMDFNGPEGRFLTIALEGQGPEILLWPGRVGEGGEISGAPAISVPGPLIIETDDLQSDFAELKAKGVRVEAAPEPYPFGMRATVFDPDGNRVSLRQTRK